MRKVLAYILGLLGVVLLVAGGVGLVAGLWLREANWVGQGIGPLVIGSALIAGARYLLRRYAAAPREGGSVPA
jgi:hypothetical protein